MNKELWIAIVICAILYRFGGIGKPFKTWMRDWLIPPIIYGLWAYFSPFGPVKWLLILPAIGLTGVALTTYWDDLFYGKDNLYMHGFMVGLGAFPLFFCGVHWYWILARAIILALTMGFLNWFVNKKQIPFRDWIEELSRGALIALTIPLLLI